VLQAQQQRELGADSLAELSRNTVPAGDGGSSDSSDEDAPEVDAFKARDQKAQQLRKHLQQKWGFPDIPGRRIPPGSVDFEFMRALYQVFQLEDCLVDEVLALRDRMCQKIGISSFGAGLHLENPCFPLILRDVVCPWCSMASHVDVTSHPSRGPGLWVCLHCEKLYDTDAIQARCVNLLDSCVQAWQSQELVCRRCRKMKNSHLQNFCDCFGRYEGRFEADDFRMVLQMLRSLVKPHNLRWLGDALDAFEPHQNFSR